MSVIPFVAAHFNAEQVLQSLAVTPEETGVRSAIQYLYRVMKEELSGISSGAIAQSRLVAGETEDFIEKRLNLLRQYSEDFFSETPVDKHALAIAALCNEYTLHINEPTQTPDGYLKTNYDGVDETLAQNAQSLWLEATAIGRQSGIPADEASPEALFLAHIFSLEELADCQILFEDNPEAENIQKLQADVAVMESLLRPDTQIGQKVMDHIRTVRSQITAHSNAPKPSLCLLKEGNSEFPPPNV